MGSSIGTALKLSIFGQSHSEAIGCVVEGLPSGFTLDQEALAAFMARRAPGQADWSTPRKEADDVRIVSGLNEWGRTCGAPLALIIENTNTRSQDYDELRRVPRPGHADFTAQAKWAGEQDVRGGGHFSARLTAPLCAAGGIAAQLLASKGVSIGAHALEIAGIPDEPLAASDMSAVGTAQLLSQLSYLREAGRFPVLDAEAGALMQQAIAAARAQKDSVGGIVECAAAGLPAGIGEPMFDGIESAIARIAFGIPAVKGLEFGRGFEVAKLLGSENNDPFAVFERERQVRPVTNNAGGNLGGITTGAPLVFRLAVKPTPSIAKPQASVNLAELKSAELKVDGRHDPCVVPRAVPVAEAAMALAVLDSWLAFPPAGNPFTL